MNKKKIYDLIFLCIALGELSSHVINNDLLHFIFKPLLLIWLSYYFFNFSRNNFSPYARLIQTGFFFSWLGDVFLLFDKEKELFFLLGLVAFLITHICYIIAFIYSVRGKPSFLKTKWVYAIPFLLAGIINVYMLLPKVGSLAVPVTIYGAAIITMVLAALNRKYAASGKSFWLVFTGALIFMISDSILSANKFMMEIPDAELLVMSTYITAQFLILKGSIAFLESESYPER